MGSPYLQYLWHLIQQAKQNGEESPLNSALLCHLSPQERSYLNKICFFSWTGREEKGTIYYEEDETESWQIEPLQTPPKDFRMPRNRETPEQRRARLQRQQVTHSRRGRPTGSTNYPRALPDPRERETHLSRLRPRRSNETRGELMVIRNVEGFTNQVQIMYSWAIRGFKRLLHSFPGQIVGSDHRH